MTTSSSFVSAGWTRRLESTPATLLLALGALPGRAARRRRGRARVPPRREVVDARQLVEHLVRDAVAAVACEVDAVAHTHLHDRAVGVREVRGVPAVRPLEHLVDVDVVDAARSLGRLAPVDLVDQLVARLGSVDVADDRRADQEQLVLAIAGHRVHQAADSPPVLLLPRVAAEGPGATLAGEALVVVRSQRQHVDVRCLRVAYFGEVRGPVEDLGSREARRDVRIDAMRGTSTTPR